MTKTAQELQHDWNTNKRWKGINRPYSPDDVLRLRGTLHIEHTLARHGADKLWTMIEDEGYVNALGAITGNQAVQQVEAGLRAIYISGWQTAADGNEMGHYPDQSLYPSNSVPSLVRRINNALVRADQIQHAAGENKFDYVVPIMADGDAGFGGTLNTFELAKDFIGAGAAGIHLEDQLSSAKKCGHLGGKVLIPTQEHINKLVAARLAADVLDVPTVIVARTDAEAATLLTTDIDERDHRFIKDEPRTSEGFYSVQNGLEAAIARGLAYAPYADLVWCETKHPDIEEARQFAEAIHAEFPGKPLMYNCSPSFNWSATLDATTIGIFQRELGAMGYKFQFITLAGFHALNLSMYELAREYAQTGMTAYAALQDREFEVQRDYGYRAVKHQTFAGTGYFDAVQTTITTNASTTAMAGSTEEEQFADETMPTVGD